MEVVDRVGASDAEELVALAESLARRDPGPAESCTAACRVETVRGELPRRLVTRLDHAACLGREMARAEAALASGGAWIQDAARVRNAAGGVGTGCGCHSKGGCP